jgi:hypothetical protein
MVDHKAQMKSMVQYACRQIMTVSIIIKNTAYERSTISIVY